jgi:hypothetical protein
MVEIIKKVYSEYFEKILSGEKKFEIRLADETYQIGDILILKEINKKREFTGREIRKKISYFVKTKDCDFWSKEDTEKYGFIVLGLESCST